MSREEVVEILNTNNNTHKLLRAYCIEQGKNEELTDTFINLIYSIPALNISTYLTSCIEYYRDKYKINLVLDINNNFLKAF